jgi:hypothetical protein
MAGTVTRPGFLVSATRNWWISGSLAFLHLILTGSDWENGHDERLVRKAVYYAKDDVAVKSVVNASYWSAYTCTQQAAAACSHIACLRGKNGTLDYLSHSMLLASEE